MANFASVLTGIMSSAASTKFVDQFDKPGQVVLVVPVVPRLTRIPAGSRILRRHA